MDRGIPDATQLYTDLVHQTVLMEKQFGHDQGKPFGMFSVLWSSRDSQPCADAATVQAILRQSIPWLVSAVRKTGDEAKRAGIKVAEAVEKFRRFTIQAKDTYTNPTTKGILAQLLQDVATCFNSAFEQVCAHLLSLRSEV